MGDDAAFPAFSALGLDDMDTKPLQLLGLDELDAPFGTEALNLNLTCDDVTGTQMASGEAELSSLDGAFDLNAFAPFQGSASLGSEKNSSEDATPVGGEESRLLQYLKMEIPVLSQNGLSGKNAGTNMAAIQNEVSPEPTPIPTSQIPGKF